MKLGIFGRHNYKVMIYLLIILILGMLFYGNYSLIEGNRGNRGNGGNGGCENMSTNMQNEANTTTTMYSDKMRETMNTAVGTCNRNKHLIS